MCFGYFCAYLLNGLRPTNVLRTAFQCIYWCISDTSARICWAGCVRQMYWEPRSIACISVFGRRCTYLLSGLRETAAASRQVGKRAGEQASSWPYHCPSYVYVTIYLEHHHICVHSNTSLYILDVPIYLMYICIYVYTYIYIYTHIHTYIYIYIYIHTIKRPSHLSPYMPLRIWSSTHDLRMIYVSKHDCASHLRNYFVRARAIICAQTTSADRPSSIIQCASPHGVRLYWYLQVILRVGPVRLIRACRRDMLPEAPV